MRLAAKSEGFEGEAMKKVAAITIASELGNANVATCSPSDAAMGISSRHVSALFPIEFGELEGSKEFGNVKNAQYVYPEVRVARFSSCKNSGKDCALDPKRVPHGGEVQPQTLPGGAQLGFEGSKVFRTRGQYDIMPLALQVVSSHLLGVLDIESALSAENGLVEQLVPHAGSAAEALKPPNFPRLFLLDGCSLTSPLGPLSSRLRANSPGSKFLALLAPNRISEAEMIGLFHWGVDGMLVLDDDWKSELLKATFALLGNRLWVPPEVLLSFIKQMKALLDRQLLPGQLLTGRESQVLQLLFRRLTNKEIACGLKISERTAKFHVCNVLNKLGLENRKNLLETFRLESA